MLGQLDGWPNILSPQWHSALDVAATSDYNKTLDSHLHYHPVGSGPLQLHAQMHQFGQ